MLNITELYGLLSHHSSSDELFLASLGNAHTYMDEMMRKMESLCSDTIAIYRHGSICYGTFVEGVSDVDAIYIVRDDSSFQDDTQFTYETSIVNVDITIYHQSTWQKMIDTHDVKAIETMLLPNTVFHKRDDVNFNIALNRELIYRNFSQVASNSWVKCKKKLMPGKDYAPRIGLKSLWHSLRLLDFATQILRDGSIHTPKCTSNLYDEIVNCKETDYAYYKAKYQTLYNYKKSLVKRVYECSDYIPPYDSVIPTDLSSVILENCPCGRKCENKALCAECQMNRRKQYEKSN